MAFRNRNSLGTRDTRHFRGCPDVARTLAHLRIAVPVAGKRRKVCFRVVGLDRLGRDSHPLDDKPNFGSYRIASSLPDQPFLVAPRSVV